MSWMFCRSPDPPVAASFDGMLVWLGSPSCLRPHFGLQPLQRVLPPSSCRHRSEQPERPLSARLVCVPIFGRHFRVHQLTRFVVGRFEKSQRCSLLGYVVRSIGRPVALVHTTGQGAPAKNAPKCTNAVGASPTSIDSVKEDKVYISANPLASLLFLLTDSAQTLRRRRKV